MSSLPSSNSLTSTNTWYTITNAVSGADKYLTVTPTTLSLNLTSTKSVFTNWQFFLSNRSASASTNAYWIRNQGIGSAFHIGISYQDANLIPALQTQASNTSALWNLATVRGGNDIRISNVGVGNFLDLVDGMGQIMVNSTDPIGSTWSLQKNGMVDDTSFLFAPGSQDSTPLTTSPSTLPQSSSPDPSSFETIPLLPSPSPSKPTPLSPSAVAAISAACALALLILITILLVLWRKRSSRAPRRFTMLNEDDFSKMEREGRDDHPAEEYSLRTRGRSRRLGDMVNEKGGKGFELNVNVEEVSRSRSRSGVRGKVGDVGMGSGRDKKGEGMGKRDGVHLIRSPSYQQFGGLASPSSPSPSTSSKSNGLPRKSTSSFVSSITKSSPNQDHSHGHKPSSTTLPSSSSPPSSPIRTSALPPKLNLNFNSSLMSFSSFTTTTTAGANPTHTHSISQPVESPAPAYTPRRTQTASQRYGNHGPGTGADVRVMRGDGENANGGKVEDRTGFRGARSSWGTRFGLGGEGKGTGGL